MRPPHAESFTLLHASCRENINAKYQLLYINQPCAAVGSLVTVQIEFVTRSEANLLRLSGWVFDGVPQASANIAGQNVEPRYQEYVFPNAMQLNNYWTIQKGRSSRTKCS